MAYSTKCHLYHEAWLNALNKINGKPCKKIYFDGNINFKEKIPTEWYDELNNLLSKHYFENENEWSMTNTQFNNLKNSGKYFDHYQYYENNDEKITQKDCFSNNFV